MGWSTDERGVSEAISFVLVFSLIVTTVGAVYAVGFSGLQEVQHDEQLRNAERAFDVLAQNVEDIVRRGAPSRATQIRLSGARLSAGPTTFINVSVTGDNQTYYTGNISSESMVYTLGDTSIKYVAGAVVRVQEGGAIMLREPNFVLGDRHVIIPVVQLTVEEGSVGGQTTVLVRNELLLRDVLVSKRGGYDTVTINVTSPTVSVWNRYLESGGLDCTTVSEQKISCTATNVQRVHVPWVYIQTTFE